MGIKVKVKPFSDKQEIKKISNKEYLVCVKDKTENNRANIELLKIMKKYLGKSVKITKGFKSRDKIVEVQEN